ncbi:MAG: pyruvate, water dikinase, partial [Thermodesulfobacteriota bacterium]
MDFIRNLFSKLFSKKLTGDGENIERLRLDFKERYHNFKLLLNSNNQSLEIMAQMEEALSGKEPFGMTFIRSACTSAGVNVYRMIQKIEELAPGKYQRLFGRYEEIQRRIEAVLSQKKELSDTRLLIFLEDLNKELVDVAGSKMANLGEIRTRLGLSVPDGFVLTA